MEELIKLLYSFKNEEDALLIIPEIEEQINGARIVAKTNTIRPMLNKININNMDEFVEKIKEYIKTIDNINEFITILFDKIELEDKYNILYALLCEKLRYHFIIDETGEKYHIRTAILSKLKKNFNDVVNIDNENKKKFINIFNLMGILYNNEFLVSNIILQCCDGLYNKIIIDNKMNINILECLVELIKICGKKMLLEKKDDVEKYINNLNKLLTNEIIKNYRRAKYIIQNFIEETNQWNKKNDDEDDGWN